MFYIRSHIVNAYNTRTNEFCVAQNLSFQRLFVQHKFKRPPRVSVYLKINNFVSPPDYNNILFRKFYDEREYYTILHITRVL